MQAEAKMDEMVGVQRPANGEEEKVCPPRLMTLKGHQPEVFVAAAPVVAEAEMADSKVVVPLQGRAVRWLTASEKRAECEGKRGHLFVHQDEEV
jgi:hypothetical protein